MTKPVTLDSYSEQYTLDCERVLVTLLRGLGPWKDSVYLVGGLTPRYLVPARPPAVPAHAGTMDVDIVIDLAQNGFKLGENPLTTETHETTSGASCVVKGSAVRIRAAAFKNS